MTSQTTAPEVDLKPDLSFPGDVLRSWSLRALSALIILGSLSTALWWGYTATLQMVTVTVNEQPFTLRTHQSTVGGALREAGLQLQQKDIVLPAVNTPLDKAGDIKVLMARPMTVEVDGRLLQGYSHHGTLVGLMKQFDVRLRSYDKVMVNGEVWDLHQPLPLDGSLGELETIRHNPLRVGVKRAVPFSVNDGGVPVTLHTTGETLLDALVENDIVTYPEDHIVPNLDTQVTAGLRVFIDRAKPLTMLVDGSRHQVRTQAETVEGALAAEGIVLRRLDYTVPARDQPISDDMTLQVVRVEEKFLVEEESIPFETVWRADSDLEIDQRRVTQAGEEGVRRRQVRVVYENGEEVKRTLEREWVSKEPEERVIAYGTKIILRTVDTPEGPKRYWRKLHVLATSYTAATSGKTKDHPAYGITRLGWQARKGVIAVDPRVINFYNKIYVPNYGIGTAVDTGGLIKGKHIDLGYDEDNLRLWYRWVDIYLLEPVPPRDEIRYVLPEYPRER